MTPAEITAESRLKEYLESYQEEGEPLEGWAIIEGHSAEARPVSYICITATTGGGGLAAAGIIESELRILILSQADDVPLADHLAAVEAVRGILAGARIASILAAINDTAWACSGLAFEGATEGRDEAANKHGTELSYRGWFANL
jgi:hypothetical protein